MFVLRVKTQTLNVEQTNYELEVISPVLWTLIQKNVRHGALMTPMLNTRDTMIQDAFCRFCSPFYFKFELFEYSESWQFKCGDKGNCLSL